MSLSTASGSIIIRDIESIAEIRAVEDLQIEAWGDDPRDIVPLNQMVAARHVGGSLIGAFDAGRLVGFVYGFLGHVGGRIVHHSHMLAVLPAYRNHNLAFRLKLAQREKVLRDNVADRITWTFDPLQSVNAHFNFGKLGVVSDTYKIDVYGEAGTSFLHRNGTDRFFVTWLIKSPRVRDRVSAGSSARVSRLPETAVLLLANSGPGLPQRSATDAEIATADAALIEIPADINSVESANFEIARKWRQETRRVFSEAMAAGFIVTEYFLKDGHTGNYLLERKQLESLS